jgi:hypothetical protein
VLGTDGFLFEAGFCVGPWRGTAPGCLLKADSQIAHGKNENACGDLSPQAILSSQDYSLEIRLQVIPFPNTIVSRSDETQNVSVWI